MSTIKLLKRVILALCLVGATVFASSCNVNHPFSSNNEKGYGGGGHGGHGGGGR